ncbi:MAG TPA: rhodanese-like domain-containing protein [Acholeplasma sp.]|nr:rhodanese-like domain-containing protein [Acholeplasma sp.]
MYKTVLTNELEQLMRKNDLNIIDVREIDELEEGHIKGVIHMPISKFAANIKKINKDEMYYVICRTGNRSGEVCQVLSKIGYKVTNVLGGMSTYQGDVEFNMDDVK